MGVSAAQSCPAQRLTTSTRDSSCATTDRNARCSDDSAPVRQGASAIQAPVDREKTRASLRARSWFRETNYEPEVLLAFFPDRQVLGWRWRLAALGLNHQSNGRSDPLSRSWNRVYLLLGVEQDNFALLIRPWLRIKESYAKDDNPDITHFLGYGDVTAVYTYRNHTLSLVVRYNPATGKGALQAAWNFPLQRRVRGYLQWFSGYGESMIDYNWRQNTIGIGLSLSDAL